MPRGKPPREYPAEVVDLICGMYLDGMTVAEIRKVAPKGYRVQTILERHLSSRRPAARRDQSRHRNHMWKGDEAGYKALHLRVKAERGRPSRCGACEEDDPNGRYEWANLTGDYANVYDYVRLCVTCHRRVDAHRRSELGAKTLSGHVRKGVMSHV